MATYNFTIRASDSAGAFADQNFSIDVQRTRIDRFVVTCASGILRSADAKTWTAEAAPSMAFVTYGNGRWIGVSNTGTPTICTSTDAVNWITSNVTLPIVPGMGASAHFLIAVKYRNGKYMAFGYVNGTSTVAEWSSSDLVTWTLVGSFAVSTGTVIVTDFEYDSATQTTVVFAASSNAAQASGVYTRVGTGAFTQTLQSPVMNLDVVVQFRNGLWMLHSPVMSPLLISRDGVNWISRNPCVGVITSGINGVAYNNGKLIVSALNNNTGVVALFSSSDGGISWVSKGDMSGASGTYRQNLGAYGGTLVAVAISGFIYSSPNDGTTGSSVTNAPLSLLGTIRSVCTRQI